ncbi:hypothetical protein KFE25_002962 [Diacronema lutheri]|uniref:ATP-dependent DNA helicase n=1 Tax=Diacronema lutheri TaxID=2081491 RepID=A0A8J5XUH3_DIALT|nr:hypothetical protein KFE25_002962 [Diacronema lutheri]
MREARAVSALRTDAVLVQRMCATTGNVEKSKRYHATELLATIDDNGIKGIAVRARAKSTPLFAGDELRGASVIERFVHEGKATLTLPAARAYILISNSDPPALREWLGALAASWRLTPRGLGGPPPAAARGLALAPVARCNVRARDDDERSVDALVDAKRARRLQSEPPLSAEQRAVVSAVLAGGSVFFTGAAGTGKSLVLRELVACLPAETTAVTATTASAAALIGGMTLHAYAGIGNGEREVSQLISSAARRRCDAWRRATVLIVDEVSMLSAELFDKLEHVARAVRGRAEPFGGLQLVLSGDFYQLPPVSTRGGPPARFAFQSRAWAHCKLREVELRQVFRQSDGELVAMLNDVRVGRLTASALATIATCARAAGKGVPGAAAGVRATKLYTHRADCDEVNQRELDALDAPAVVLRAFDSGDGARGASPTALLDGCAARPQLVLKEGAQVLLLRSLAQAEGLTNGSRGVVVRFERGLPAVRFASGAERVVERQPFLVVQDGRCVAVRSQVPLALGWALSIHRSQGLSLDLLEVSVDRAFECGQAYVALSRARSLRGLHVRSFDPTAVRAHPDVVDFHEGIARRAKLEAAAQATAQAEAGTQERNDECASARAGAQLAADGTSARHGATAPQPKGGEAERLRQRLAELRRERAAQEAAEERHTGARGE